MDFETLKQITNEAEQVNKTYEIFNEDARLSRSKGAQVEFLTTVRYIEKYLKPGNKVLDIGAGAGVYSLYFAQKGYEVCAVELADNNIAAFRKKLTPELNIDLRQGNALDLSEYADESFDVVLLLGPLYHLHSEADRQQAIANAKRVCKKDGVIFMAFVNNDAVVMTEVCYDKDWLRGDTYDHATFKVEDFPFVFLTVEQCRACVADSGLKTLHEVASDGLSELLEEKIEEFSEEAYAQYLKYHFYSCEKTEMLGHSNHLLFVGQK